MGSALGSLRLATPWVVELASVLRPHHYLHGQAVVARLMESWKHEPMSRPGRAQGLQATSMYLGLKTSMQYTLAEGLPRGNPPRGRSVPEKGSETSGFNALPRSTLLLLGAA